MFGWDWTLSNNLVKLLVLHFPDKKNSPIASIMEAPGSFHHYYFSLQLNYYDPYIVSGHSDLLTFTH
jgi:hypothetical protein